MVYHARERYTSVDLWSAVNAQLALKALSEPRRCEILDLLRASPMAVVDIAERVEVTQQAVSQHLKVLEQAGLVEARRVGTRHIYTVRPEGFAPVESFVRRFWDEKLAKLKRESEG